MATDFLDQKRAEIAARLSELKPLVTEYERLEAAAAALDSLPATSARARPARRGAAPSAPGRDGDASSTRRGRGDPRAAASAANRRSR